VPEPAKKPPTVPTEADFTNFFAWLDAKEWEFMSVFLRVKAVAGCRTADLCQVAGWQFNPKAHTLTILAIQDMTNRQRVVPLLKLSQATERHQGESVPLGELHDLDLRTHERPARRNGVHARLAMAVRRLSSSTANTFPTARRSSRTIYDAPSR
jgi:hypothetical protein